MYLFEEFHISNYNNGFIAANILCNWSRWGCISSISLPLAYYSVVNYKDDEWLAYLHFYYFSHNTFTGLCLLSVVDQVYDKVPVKQIRKSVEGVICGEQGEFRGVRCVNQELQWDICKNIERKARMYIFWAIMNLEKSYDIIDWKGFWTALRFCGLGGTLLRWVQSFMWIVEYALE